MKQTTTQKSFKEYVKTRSAVSLIAKKLREEQTITEEEQALAENYIAKHKAFK